MATIDIKKGFRQYSPAQLREYAYNNLLTVGSFEINDFVEYIFAGYSDEVYQEGFEDGSQTWQDDD